MWLLCLCVQKKPTPACLPADQSINQSYSALFRQTWEQKVAAEENFLLWTSKIETSVLQQYRNCFIFSFIYGWPLKVLDRKVLHEIKGEMNSFRLWCCLSFSCVLAIGHFWRIGTSVNMNWYMSVGSDPCELVPQTRGKDALHLLHDEVQRGKQGAQELRERNGQKQVRDLKKTLESQSSCSQN